MKQRIWPTLGVGVIASVTVHCSRTPAQPTKEQAVATSPASAASADPVASKGQSAGYRRHFTRGAVTVTPDPSPPSRHQYPDGLGIHGPPINPVAANSKVPGANGALGTTTKPWQEFCQATFITDHDQPLKDVAHHFARGQRFVIAQWEGPETVALQYITPDGPFLFRVSAAPGAQIPVKADCTDEQSTQHLAVFRDVTLFAEPELETNLCELKAGSSYELRGLYPEIYGAGSSPRTRQAISGINLAPLAKDCPGHGKAFYPVRMVKVFETLYSQMEPFGFVARRKSTP